MEIKKLSIRQNQKIFFFDISMHKYKTAVAMESKLNHQVDDVSKNKQSRENILIVTIHKIIQAHVLKLFKLIFNTTYKIT